MSVTANIRFRQNQAVMAADIDGEFVLMDADQGLYFGLNETGSEIWRRIGDAIDFKTLIDHLCQSFHGNPTAIENETRSLLETLLSHGLVIIDKTE